MRIYNYICISKFRGATQLLMMQLHFAFKVGAQIIVTPFACGYIGSKLVKTLV